MTFSPQAQKTLTMYRERAEKREREVIEAGVPVSLVDRFRREVLALMQKRYRENLASMKEVGFTGGSEGVEFEAWDHVEYYEGHNLAQQIGKEAGISEELIEKFGMFGSEWLALETQREIELIRDQKSPKRKLAIAREQGREEGRREERESMRSSNPFDEDRFQ